MDSNISAIATSQLDVLRDRAQYQSDEQVDIFLQNEINFSRYPTLVQKEPHFKELVSIFTAHLSTLSETQKDKLALLLAVELTNSIVQKRESKNSANRLGREKAAESFRIVRAVIRERQICLFDQEPISLQDPELKPIVNEAAQIYATKNDPDQFKKAMALSTAWCIILNKYLPRRLDQFHQNFQNLYPLEIMEEITERFISPYQVKG